MFGSFSIHTRAEDAKGYTIYGDINNKYSFYERAVQLSNGDLLATWMREFPIKTNWSRMKVPQFYKSISLESVNKPGYYLRHRNGILELSINDGTQLIKADATSYQIKQ